MEIKDRYAKWIKLAAELDLDRSLNDGAWTHKIKIFSPDELTGSYLEIKIDDRDKTSIQALSSVAGGKSLTEKEAIKMLTQWSKH